MSDQSIANPVQLPPAHGLAFEGGFYVGRYRIDGRLHALIASPRLGDIGPIAWGRSGEIAGAGSFSDGLANTHAMADAGSDLAQRMLKLSINGRADWYLPARDELELVYRWLKPTRDENFRLSGDNPSAMSPTWPYSASEPAQTSAQAFQAGGPEALDTAWYWSSTQYSAHLAWNQWFDDGNQDDGVKSYEGRARAVRRLILE